MFFSHHNALTSLTIIIINFLCIWHASCGIRNVQQTSIFQRLLKSCALIKKILKGGILDVEEV